ncbi:MAG: MBOAT family protein [Bacteroidetes bacterium]|nr:MBOAT family protein [Bacteroidota bacterium]
MEPIFGFELSLSKTILPIGLSFHTFQSISYVIDVYRKTQKPETHLGIYSNYVLFFPQMVAGPIERYANLGNQLNNKTSFDFSTAKKGVQLILIGLFYKMVIADNCGIYVNGIYENISKSNAANSLLAILLFSVQIYADFFGYSLIAQGSASLFGIGLIDNFRFPFFSKNIIEFWQRWHISLTSWFRNYLFIPLGGSKNGKFKHYRNIIIIFSLSGLWHGASWNFILWGTLHALCYTATITLKPFFSNLLPSFLKYTFTFLLVSFIFVFFRSTTFFDSIELFKSLLDYKSAFFINSTTIFLFILIAFTFVIESFAFKKDSYANFLNYTSGNLKVIILTTMLFCILL